MKLFSKDLLQVAVKAIDDKTVLCWFRRDLRLDDNAALYHALKEHESVLPLFIFDSFILENLPTEDARLEFIHSELEKMKKELEGAGSTLLILVGDPVELLDALPPMAVYTNRDYEPYARRRDGAVEQLLTAKGVPFKTFKDQVVFEKEEVLKDSGSPYTVFTPYSRKWRARLDLEGTRTFDCRPLFGKLKKIAPMRMPALIELGFRPAGRHFPDRTLRSKLLKGYGQSRDYPGVTGTSRLGIHLRFGTISIRQVVKEAIKSPTFLNELIWREFFSMILWHFPQVEEHAFKPAYDRICWINSEEYFERWCNGTTGYPMVDAGMRELNETGYMHNRVRMVVASFLTKHLLIDWRWGEQYFAQRLLDFDLASNNGGWQWAAGSGCDAAPWFRIFNPKLQQEKFDPDGGYVNHWVPECGNGLYPEPMVDHVMARRRALEVYQKALRE